MDPIHLLPDELDYELDIRGVFNLSSTRQKTQCLREFLVKEASGVKEFSEASLKQLNPTAELATCGRICEEVLTIMLADKFEHSTRQDCRSRLLHVLARIKRAKPTNPEEQALSYELLRMVEDHLQVYNQSEAISHPQKSPALSKPISPLADIIERIHITRRNKSKSANSLNKVATCESNEFRQSSHSVLNPAVREFIPESSSREQLQMPNAQSGLGVADEYNLDLLGASFGPRDAFRNPYAEEYERHVRRPVNDGQIRREIANRAAGQGQPISVASGSVCGEEAAQQQRQPWRAMRKSVPVHQWRISFSGDGQGMHLYDFLSEIRVFQRSEQISDGELLASVVHLLTGRARLWYRAYVDTFNRWEDMVAAMKTEFLPPKHDFKLLMNISNRKQKSSESFGEYLTLMQSWFTHLSTPIDEQRKLCIIEDNMLSKYAIATSVLDIESLEQLSRVCRRVDYAYSNSSTAFPQSKLPEQRQQNRQGQQSFRPRALHEMGAVFQHDDQHGEWEETLQESSGPRGHEQFHDQQRDLLVMQNGGNYQARDPTSFGQRECFNCRRPGHAFAACRAPRNGVFCYRCGSRDVTTFTCQNCAKNDRGDSVGRPNASNPRPK